MKCKVLEKILASWLEKVLPGIIDKGHVGFIKGTSSADNVRRLIHLMWLNTSENAPIIATCLDGEKAFNRMELGFLSAVLSNFGFDHIFKTWVSLSYKNPRAAVMTNGMTSLFFTISRGTHQGCPLSPLCRYFFIS